MFGDPSGMAPEKHKSGGDVLLGDFGMSLLMTYYANATVLMYECKPEWGIYFKFGSFEKFNKELNMRINKRNIIFWLLCVCVILVSYYIVPKIWYYRFLNDTPLSTESIQESKDLGLFINEYVVFNEQSDLRILEDNRIEESWIEKYAEYSNDYRYPNIYEDRAVVNIKLQNGIQKNYLNWYFKGFALTYDGSNIFYTSLVKYSPEYDNLTKDTVTIDIVSLIKDPKPVTILKSQSPHIQKVGQLVLVKKKQ